MVPNDWKIGIIIPSHKKIICDIKEFQKREERPRPYIHDQTGCNACMAFLGLEKAFDRGIQNKAKIDENSKKSKNRKYVKRNNLQSNSFEKNYGLLD